MTLNNRTNLMRVAEEVAYSSKGHMKSADWVGLSLKVFIGFPIVISIALLAWQDLNKEFSRILNCIAFIFSSLVFTSPILSSPEKSAELIKNHMELGNDYLQIYKDIRNLVADNNITKSDIDKISERVKNLDTRTGKLKIGFIARFWSKCRIHSEMDLDWIEK